MKVKLLQAKYKERVAFTLAEVLITLLIIGVVSSIVIPALLSDTQDAEFKTAWRKSYSVLEQATRRIAMDNGGTLKGLCDDGDDNCLRNYYATYLNYTKKCNNGATVGTCWHNNNTWKTLKGVPLTWGIGAGLIFNDGTLFFASNINKECSHPYGDFNVCGEMAVDINGFKGPNTVGKDIFYVHILENSIKPCGIQGDGLESSCDSSNTGVGCAAKYLYQ